MIEGISQARSLGPAARTEAASAAQPVRKKTKEEEQEELRLQKEELQAQLLTAKSATDAPSDEAVKAIESKLAEVDQALGAPARPATALERLQGQTDTYEEGGDPGAAALEAENEARSSLPAQKLTPEEPEKAEQSRQELKRQAEDIRLGTDGRKREDAGKVTATEAARADRAHRKTSPSGTEEPGEAPEQPKKAERTTVNTDQVDREISTLKKQVEDIKRQRTSESDPAESEQLKREQTAKEAELQQKDSDAYRKQHAVWTESPLQK